MKYQNQSGLTLIEVMVGIFILAVGVLAAAGLQTSSLRATRASQQVQVLNAAARSELEFQRGFLTNYSGVPLMAAEMSCTIADSADSGYSCVVVTLPCLVTGTDITCIDASVASPVGYSVTVGVTDGNRSVRLESFVAVLP